MHEQNILFPILFNLLVVCVCASIVLEWKVKTSFTFQFCQVLTRNSAGHMNLFSSFWDNSHLCFASLIIKQNIIKIENRLEKLFKVHRCSKYMFSSSKNAKHLFVVPFLLSIKIITISNAVINFKVITSYKKAQAWLLWQRS